MAARNLGFMTPRDLIKCRKSVAKPGAWKVVTGKAKMGKNAFPLSGMPRLGRGWHWRVDVLDASGMRLTLFTAFNTDYAEYRAWLSAEREDDYVVLARYENHGEHPGWHCHAPCCDISAIDAGQPVARESTRFPGGNNDHRKDRHMGIDIATFSETDALAAAFRFFKVSAPDGDGHLL